MKMKSQVKIAADRSQLFGSLQDEIAGILKEGYVVIGSPDEVADQLRRIATEFNFGNLLMLLQFGNMDKQTTMYNTRMFAERVMPQLARPVRERMGAQVVAEAAGEAGQGRAAFGGGGMSAPQIRTVEIAGRPCRISEQGSGSPLFYVPSSVLSLKWSPFHEALAARARLVSLSLPGFGGSEGHELIDDHLAWCLAARDLLVAAGFKPGDTLIGSSAAGAIAADVAALWPEFVGKLVLIAPFGLYDMREPTRDLFTVLGKEAPGVFCENPQAYSDQVLAPQGEDAGAWSIVVNRAHEAAARILWPFGETRLARRLHRIAAPTLLLWGAADKVVPPSYAQKFSDGMKAKVTAKTIAGGGHLVELDRFKETAAAVLEFAVTLPRIA